MTGICWHAVARTGALNVASWPVVFFVGESDRYCMRTALGSADFRPLSVKRSGRYRAPICIACRTIKLAFRSPRHEWRRLGRLKSPQRPRSALCKQRSGVSNDERVQPVIVRRER